MSFTFKPINERYARTVLSWHYEAPYDIYNFVPVTNEHLEEAIAYVLEPEYAYHCLFDTAGEFVAFCSFGLDGQVPGGDYSDDALDIGMGVRPDKTGQGQGHLYRDAVLDFARRTFAPTAFRVTVAEFNKRALCLWQNAGFRPIQQFEANHSGLPFVVLIRQERT